MFITGLTNHSKDQDLQASHKTVGYCPRNICSSDLSPLTLHFVTFCFRYQKTQAEAQTLSLVQKELSHLDSLLSADVAILRDKIEESSREYLQAQ